MAERWRTLVRGRRPMAMGAALCLVLTLGTAHRGHASPISILDGVDDEPATLERHAQLPSNAGQELDAATIPFAAPNAAISPAEQPLVASGSPPIPSSPSSSMPSSTGETSEAIPERPTNENTARALLGSIISWHRGAEAPTATRRFDQGQYQGARRGDEGEIGIDLRQLILDSEIGGAMLRAVVSINSADGNGATFSIFGLGNFAIDFASDLHAAIISELSTGTAFRMSMMGEKFGYDAYPGAAVGANTPATRENINILRVVWNWILDFIYSPVGALLSMSAIIALLLWIGVKSVMFLQRRV